MGSAAPQAAKVLAGDGYKNVYVVKGGAQGPQGWRVSYSFFQAGCCSKVRSHQVWQLLFS